MTVQLEIVSPYPYVADSVAIEIAPDTCDTCGEVADDCIKCDACESCPDDCECASCERCGHVMDDYDVTTVNLGYNYTSRRTVSEEWCGECIRHHATTCDGCDDAHAGDSYTYTMSCCDRELCEGCREYSNYCESCDESYCDGCDHYGCVGSSEFIAGYHSGNPHGTVFHGTGTPLFMGVELELSANADDAGDLLEILGGYDNVHFEEDGSVHDGWEFIFSPRTLASWQEFATSGVFSRLHSRGVRGGDHGFHVHVSKAAFKSGNAARRFADLMSGRGSQDAKSMLEFIAGRPENHWALFENHNRRNVAKDALKGHYRGGRGAVNLSTYKPTFEIRLGCGTTNPSSILAWLETIAMAVEIANTVDLTLEAWGALDAATAMIQWADGRPEYTHAHAAMRAWEIQRDRYVSRYAA